MYLARIDGTVTSTIRHASLKGYHLLIGTRIDADGAAMGEPQIVLDRLGAGYGSIVLVTSEGELARQITGAATTPSRMSVLAIVDDAGRRP
jgi:ethanolamine utilization protein EutN